MKYRKHFEALMVLALSFIMAACSQSATPTSDTQTGEEIIVAYEDPEAEQFEDAIKDLPKEKQDELRLRRKASLALYPHLKLDGQEYRIDISAEEAAKLGVPEWIYEAVKRDLAETNKTIATMAAEGVELDLPDPEEIVKKMTPINK